MAQFTEKYGPWALVAGGARGIGEAYTHYVASLGLNVVVIDNSIEALDALREHITDQYEVDFLALELNLGNPGLLAELVEAVGEREIGLLIYNAAIADVGPFYKSDSGIEHEMEKIAVNVSTPLQLVYHFARPMLERKCGGVILMSSGAGMQGAPYYAHYAATKAYNLVLAESLWSEFKPYNVDVLACIAGMTMSTAAQSFAHLDTSDFQSPAEVVDEAMAALGRHSSVLSGEKNRQNQQLLSQLSREQQIKIIGQHALENFFSGDMPEQNI